VSLDIGAIIDRRYLLKREIARGGAGAVFEAEHVYTKRSVALKLLIPEQRSVPELRARLLREALALSTARHPGVVAALDAGETDDGTPYLVLELLEGRSLEGILAVRRRIAAAEVAWVGIALCDALGAAHRQGIIHRDIKPSNVFVARNEQGHEVIKLFDFGVAHIPDDKNALTQDKNKLTQAGGLLGTPEYMAPEQLLARPVDARTDIYALGVTLYECLAGVVPFEGNFGEVLLKVSTQSLPPLRQKVPDIPADFAEAIEQALASEPHFRYADVESFAQALRKAAPVAAAVSLLGIRQGPPPMLARQVAVADAASVSRAAAPVASRAAPVPPPLPPTRRRFPRAPYVTPVRIVHGQSVLDGRSQDLSVGGLLVLAPQAFDQAELVKVRFALPMTGKVIEIGATARWVKAARATGAVGLQFSALPAEAHEVIERYVTMMGGE